MHFINHRVRLAAARGTQPRGMLNSITHVRSSRRRRLVAHLHASGPRPVLKALLETLCQRTRIVRRQRGRTALTNEMIATALQEAREILARELDNDPGHEFSKVDFLTFAETCRLTDDKRQPTRTSVAVERCAPSAMVEALMYALSTRNTAALREPKIQGWLAHLSKDQFYEVGDRLQRLKREELRGRAATARAWTADEVQQLLRAKA
jgi:hypothetical protein